MQSKFPHLAIVLAIAGTSPLFGQQSGAPLKVDSARHADSASPEDTAAAEPVMIPAGVPLHIRTTRTAHLHTGAAVEGVLTQAIFVRDRLVLPIGSPVQGVVTGYAPVERLEREQALLNGDVTPLHDPIVDFTALRLDGATTGDPTQDIRLDAPARIRDTQVVRFTGSKKTSLIHQAIAIGKERVHESYDAIFGPGKKDRALRLLYGQLPYHPQRIWSGTQFVADLSAPATVMLPAEPITPVSTTASLNGITVEARLAEPLTSSTAKKGDPVRAIITAPVFDAQNNLILPEGAQLDGLVSASKPARSFGRNGQLRFAIRGLKDFGTAESSTQAAEAESAPVQKSATDAPSLESAAHKQQELSHPAERQVYGTVTGAEGNAGESLSVDAEGNVKANPDQNRFIAPLLLAATAAGGQDSDGGLAKTTVASNGFGIIARVIALMTTNHNVATGFGAYAFAKSVYFRFLVRGHEVSFPKDTQVEVALSSR